MTKTIAIVNEKGGTGKTTTSVNLSAALGELGQRVLLVDLDGQAASSRWLGVEDDTRFADALWKGEAFEPIPEVIPGVWLAPGSGKLDSVAHDLRPTQGGQLRKVLSLLPGFDHIIIDCPPSLGNRLIGNAMLAATHAIVPVEVSILALDGLRILLTTFQDVRDGFGHDIALAGVLACRYDHRTKLSRFVLSELHRALPGKVFTTVIRENIRMRECPGSGQSILTYASDSHAAEDYRALAKEVLAGRVNSATPGSEGGEDGAANAGELTEKECQAILDMRGQITALLHATGPKAGGHADAVELDESNAPAEPVEQIAAEKPIELVTAGGPADVSTPEEPAGLEPAAEAPVADAAAVEPVPEEVVSEEGVPTEAPAVQTVAADAAPVEPVSAESPATVDTAALIEEVTAPALAVPGEDPVAALTEAVLAAAAEAPAEAPAEVLCLSDADLDPAILEDVLPPATPSLAPALACGSRLNDSEPAPAESSPAEGAPTEAAPAEDAHTATLQFPIGVDVDARQPKAHLDRVVEEPEEPPAEEDPPVQDPELAAARRFVEAPVSELGQPPVEEPKGLAALRAVLQSLEHTKDKGQSVHEVKKESVFRKLFSKRSA